MAEVTAQTERLNKAIADKEGKYLTFALASEEYGLEILKVRERY
jgi:chemotaxis signal transduction protein